MQTLKFDIGFHRQAIMVQVICYILCGNRSLVYDGEDIERQGFM